MDKNGSSPEVCHRWGMFSSKLPDKSVTLAMGLAHKNRCILPKSYLNSIQAAHENAESIDIYGAPYETRTRVSGVRGQRPGPLDEGSE